MKIYSLSFLLALLFSTSNPMYAQNPQAYTLYRADGKPVKFKQMVKELAKAEVVLFGESHNDPIAHWMQLLITQSLYEALDGQLLLGAEMFEADNQTVLNEYLGGFIREKDLKKEAKVWPNYETDYKPLLDFALENQLPFIATNIPRRYANLVYRRGLEVLDSLSYAAKKHIAPLPIQVNLDLKCYKDILQMAAHGGSAQKNLPYSQAVKDATMAWFIVENLPPVGVFLHFNGSYHSDNKESIFWYIQEYRPQTEVMTITTVSQDDISKLEEEHLNKADFILCTPKNMTKTY